MSCYKKFAVVVNKCESTKCGDRQGESISKDVFDFAPNKRQSRTNCLRLNDLLDTDVKTPNNGDYLCFTGDHWSTCTINNQDVGYVGYVGATGPRGITGASPQGLEGVVGYDGITGDKGEPYANQTMIPQISPNPISNGVGAVANVTISEDDGTIIYVVLESNDSLLQTGIIINNMVNIPLPYSDMTARLISFYAQAPGKTLSNRVSVFQNGSGGNTS